MERENGRLTSSAEVEAKEESSPRGRRRFAVPQGVHDHYAVQCKSGGLPGPLREEMESCFDADFSSVRVHEDGEAGKLGALAFTRGEDLHFAPGKYDPASHSGRELIGHELTHVVQQRAGRVSQPQGKGAPVNADDSLEAEADRGGAAAAAGGRFSVAGAGSGIQPKWASAPIQCAKDPKGIRPKSIARIPHAISSGIHFFKDGDKWRCIKNGEWVWATDEETAWVEEHHGAAWGSEKDPDAERGEKEDKPEGEAKPTEGEAKPKEGFFAKTWRYGTNAFTQGGLGALIPSAACVIAAPFTGGASLAAIPAMAAAGGVGGVVSSVAGDASKDLGASERTESIIRLTTGALSGGVASGMVKQGATTLASSALRGIAAQAAVQVGIGAAGMVVLEELKKHDATAPYANTINEVLTSTMSSGAGGTGMTIAAVKTAFATVRGQINDGIIDIPKEQRAAVQLALSAVESATVQSVQHQQAQQQKAAEKQEPKKKVILKVRGYAGDKTRNAKSCIVHTAGGTDDRDVRMAGDRLEDPDRLTVTSGFSNGGQAAAASTTEAASVEALAEQQPLRQPTLMDYLVAEATEGSPMDAPRQERLDAVRNDPEAMARIAASAKNTHVQGFGTPRFDTPDVADHTVKNIPGDLVGRLPSVHSVHAPPPNKETLTIPEPEGARSMPVIGPHDNGNYPQAEDAAAKISQIVATSDKQVVEVLVQTTQGLGSTPASQEAHGAKLVADIQSQLPGNIEVQAEYSFSTQDGTIKPGSVPARTPAAVTTAPAKVAAAPISAAPSSQLLQALAQTQQNTGTVTITIAGADGEVTVTINGKARRVRSPYQIQLTAQHHVIEYNGIQRAFDLTAGATMPVEF